MTPIERTPPPSVRWVALAAALVAAGASGLASALALGVAAIGVVVLAAGVVRGVGAGASIGGALLGVAGLLAGVRGASPLLVVGSVLAAVVAWDAATSAVDLGRQVGSEADARRALGVHVGATAGVGLLVAGASYGLFRVAAGGQPVAALVLLLAAAVLAVLALG